jgi:hypothetical protein
MERDRVMEVNVILEQLGIDPLRWIESEHRRGSDVDATLSRLPISEELASRASHRDALTS